MSDVHERTARYFDGETEGMDEQAALDHLASCARCQAELGDLIGFEVGLARKDAIDAQPNPSPNPNPDPNRSPNPNPNPSPSPNPNPNPSPLPDPGGEAIPITAARRARARMIGAGLGALAAAAIILIVIAKRPRDRGQEARPAPQLALAPERTVEARFSAGPFAIHRPYVVARGATDRERFSLDALAHLERAGERAALAAAYASSGELERARTEVMARPASADRDVDLAAIALLAGKPEDALEAADRALAEDPRLPAARWNRALALRELGLPLAAAADLAAVDAAQEPGWAAEATRLSTALRAAMTDRAEAADAFTARAKAMIDRTGPIVSDDDVRRFPGYARLYFHDALRASATRDEAAALAPVAAALDRMARTEHAGQALARVTALSPAQWRTRAPLARAYRELALGRAPGSGAALVPKLARAGGMADDLLLGAILFAGETQARIAQLARLADATGDPWFTLLVARERGRGLVAAGALDRAEVVLRGALAGCEARVAAHRCGGLAFDLASLYGQVTRYAEAEEHAALAVRMYAAAGAPEVEDHALSLLAEMRRGRGRFALASATFREVRARVGDRNCATTRYATSGLALIAVYLGADALDVDPPAPDACGLPPNPIELTAMIDLARMTGRDDDRVRATLWIDAARAAGDPQLARAAGVAAARLAIEDGPDAAARLRALLPELAGETDTDTAVRAWAYQTLVDDAARRGAWAEVVATIAEEAGVRAPATCVLAVGVDDTRGAAAAIGAGGAATGARTTIDSPVAWTGAALVPAALHDALAGCASIAVLARPPVHGRADLLPAHLPWAFVGPRAVPPTGAPPATGGRELIVGDAVPPPALALPALAPVRAPDDAIVLRGAAATPPQVLAALATATYAELHVHGQVDLGVADASFLALSPGPDEGWALTAADVRAAALPTEPVVVLAACRAAAAAPYQHKRWSLPDAFLAAGARAVVAPTVEIPDDEAAAFFEALRTRLRAGAPIARALATLRADTIARGQAWAANVILFE